MKQSQREMTVRTDGRGLFEVTGPVQEIVRDSGIHFGLCIVFCQHTSCSLLIQENADPSARRDLEAWLDRLAPDGDSHYTHTAEGVDDMPAHIRAAVTRTAETIPVATGRLALGTWQGLFLAEHRLGPHARRLLVQVIGA